MALDELELKSEQAATSRGVDVIGLRTRSGRSSRGGREHGDAGSLGDPLPPRNRETTPAAGGAVAREPAGDRAGHRGRDRRRFRA